MSLKVRDCDTLYSGDTESDRSENVHHSMCAIYSLTIISKPFTLYMVIMRSDDHGFPLRHSRKVRRTSVKACLYHHEQPRVSCSLVKSDHRDYAAISTDKTEDSHVLKRWLVVECVAYSNARRCHKLTEC